MCLLKFLSKIRYKFRLLQSYLNELSLCHIIHKPVNIRRAEVTVTAYIYPILTVWQVGYLLHYICSVVGYERGTAEMVGVVVDIK